MTVEADVTNTGAGTGAEIVQLYVGSPSSSAVPEAPQELQGFQKVLLTPGQTGHVTFTLTPRSFSYWKRGRRQLEDLRWPVPDPCRRQLTQPAAVRHRPARPGVRGAPMTGTHVSRRALIGGAAAVAGAAPLIAVGAAGAATASAIDDQMDTDAAWAALPRRPRPGVDRIPTNFYQSAFTGNGGLGASLFQTGTAKRLSLRLGDSRVRDHQGTGGTNFGNARLPIGELLLNTSGDVTGVDLRLSLWNAEVAGTSRPARAR
jgi:hypothetical protein